MAEEREGIPGHQLFYPVYPGTLPEIRTEVCEGMRIKIVQHCRIHRNLCNAVLYRKDKENGQERAVFRLSPVIFSYDEIIKCYFTDRAGFYKMESA